MTPVTALTSEPFPAGGNGSSTTTEYVTITGDADTGNAPVQVSRFPDRLTPAEPVPKVASSNTSDRSSVTVTAGSATLLVLVSASV